MRPRTEAKGMKTFKKLLWVIPLLCAVIGCGDSTRYRLVSEKYGFSVEFPEKPTERSSINDEGLPKSSWEFSREKVVAKDYYTAEATSYKEVLNPDDELVPNEALLALKGAIHRRTDFLYLRDRRTQHDFCHCQNE